MLSNIARISLSHTCRKSKKKIRLAHKAGIQRRKLEKREKSLYHQYEKDFENAEYPSSYFNATKVKVLIKRYEETLNTSRLSFKMPDIQRIEIAQMNKEIADYQTWLKMKQDLNDLYQVEQLSKVFNIANSFPQYLQEELLNNLQTFTNNSYILDDHIQYGRYYHDQLYWLLPEKLIETMEFKNYLLDRAHENSNN